MKKQKVIFSWLTATLIFAGLYFSSLYNYLLFHNLAELFSIFVALSIFFIVWNVRKFLQQPYLFFMGIAYLFIGCLDLLHTLAYKGMPIFKDYDYYANQLWIVARYLESLSFLIGFVFVGQKKWKFNPYLILTGYGVVLVLAIFSIFVWKNFPVCFIDGVGQTAFKIVSEYVIILILILNIGLLYLKRNYFDPRILKLLFWSVLATIGSEVMFTLYITNYGVINLAGHYFKIVSFYLVYEAVIAKGLSEPYHFLFLNLKQSEERFKELAELLPLAVFEADTQGKVVYMNRMMRGYFPPEEESPRVSSFLRSPDAPAWKEQLLKTPLSSEPLIFSSSKKEFPVLFYTGLILREHLVEGVRGVFLDVTVLRGMEDQLRKSNERLSSFAHGVAHDLRAPLVTVKGFVDLLKSRIQDQLDEEEKDFLDVIVKTLTRSDEMIRDLLNYSEIDHSQAPRERVNLDKEVREILENLAVPILETGAEIYLENLPSIPGQKVYLMQLFQNLIQNALKFHAKDKKPEIRVIGEVKDRVALFRIQDNGIGIAEADQPRIFEMFHRLHSQRDYPGFGIGLASCKRIVESHGGSIRVQSVPGEGTTFFISLPA